MREDSSSYVFPLDDTTMPTDIYSLSQLFYLPTHRPHQPTPPSWIDRRHCVVHVSDVSRYGRGPSIECKNSFQVFVIIGLLLIVSNVSSEMAARRMATNLEKMAPAMENIQSMEPEEAGKMVGEFLKGLETAQKGEFDVRKGITRAPGFCFLAFFIQPDIHLNALNWINNEIKFTFFSL